MSQGGATVESLTGGKRLLSDENQHLYRELELVMRDFCEIRTVFRGSKRVDVPAYGISSEYALRTPFLIYDLPELTDACPTAFTDGFRVFFSANLFKEMLKLREEGKEDCEFVISHELEHIRLLHTSRMKDVDRVTANIAQDIRINIDLLTNITACRHFFNSADQADYDRALEPSAFKEHYKVTCEKHSGAIIKGGCGTHFEDRAKWRDMSSEQIALALEAERPKSIQATTEEIMKAAANAIADAMKDAGSSDQNLSDLADTLNKIGDRKHSKSDLEKVVAEALGAIGSEEIKASDAKKSNVDDAVPESLDDLKPSTKIAIAAQAAEQMLNPQKSAKNQGGGGGGGKGESQQEANGDSQGNEPGADGTPSQGKDKGKSSRASTDGKKVDVGHGDMGDVDTHYIPPEDLGDILDRAGAQNLSAALGYDTPEKVQKMASDTSSNIDNAIRKAAEDVRKANGSYPGQHMVDAALKDLSVKHYRPVLVLEKLKNIISQYAGKRKTNYDIMTPSMLSSAMPSDLGLSEGDMPYLGSQRPVKPKKNLIVAVVDTSGSTSGILDSLVGEAIGLARQTRKNETTPEIIFLSADTIVRGKPMLINEGNLAKLRDNGVGVAGFGGTDFLAPLIGVSKMTEKGGVFQGRKIDHIFYFTDGECWLPPRDKLPEQLPPVLFVVPESHYSSTFDSATKQSGWCDSVFFGEKEVKIAPGRRTGMKA